MTSAKGSGFEHAFSGLGALSSKRSKVSMVSDLHQEPCCFEFEAKQLNFFKKYSLASMDVGCSTPETVSGPLNIHPPSF